MNDAFVSLNAPNVPFAAARDTPHICRIRQ